MNRGLFLRFRKQHFTGGYSKDFFHNCIFVNRFHHPEGAGGNIQIGNPENAVFLSNRQQVVVGLFIQKVIFDNHTRGNHPNDIAFHQTLCGGGVFHLITDSDFISVVDEPGDVGFCGTHGDSAHGDRLGIFLVP